MRITLVWVGLAAATSIAFGGRISAQGLTQDGLPIDNRPRVILADARGHDRQPQPRVAAGPALPRASTGCGLAADASGTLTGIADGYKAVFLADGLEYTPVLGRRAAHDMPLRYRLVAAGRGSAMQPATSARRSHDRHTVRYERAELVETYEVRGDGVKQSFVFRKLPAGHGDLVVRGALTTELVAGPVTAHGMSFDLPGVGGVTIGAVLGYDAAGHRVQGEMRCVGGSIEFSLPASFVDGAVMPVVIDPLIGTTVTLGGANDDNLPDVAWEGHSATWLVVWRRDLSATNQDIRGQRVDGSGVLSGGQINLETDTATLATTPRLAYVNAARAFVVVWSAGGDIYARGLSAVSGTLTPEVTVASGSNNHINPDIGGELLLSGGNAAYAVWEDATAATISLRPITYNANHTLTLGSTTAVTSGYPDSDPSISQAGGDSGVWLVTWTRDLSGNLDIRGRIWVRANGFVSSYFSIENTADDCAQSSCDGDGFNWVVAYARYEAGLLTRDVDARSVLRQLSGQSLGPTVTLAGDANDDETAPSVGWLGNSALVGYIDLNGAGNFDAYVRSIDPFRCDACEGLFVLDGTAATTEIGVQVCSMQHVNYEAGTVGACVWHSFNSATSAGDIDFIRFNPDDGAVNELAEACGMGGLCHATCGISPNVDFELRLRRAAPSALAFVVLGFQELNYACGPCTLVPDPFTGLITTTMTDGSGNAVVPLPVPSGVSGNSLILQWLVPGNNCFTSFDMSNAVRITVQ